MKAIMKPTDEDPKSVFTTIEIIVESKVGDNNQVTSTGVRISKIETDGEDEFFVQSTAFTAAATYCAHMAVHTSGFKYKQGLRLLMDGVNTLRGQDLNNASANSIEAKRVKIITEMVKAQSK